MNLPPLPEAHIKRDAYIYDSLGEIVDTAPPLLGYTPKQMREYGALCYRKALEDSAKFLEMTDLSGVDSVKQNEYGQVLFTFAKYIRELSK